MYLRNLFKNIIEKKNFNKNMYLLNKMINDKNKNKNDKLHTLYC